MDADVRGNSFFKGSDAQYLVSIGRHMKFNAIVVIAEMIALGMYLVLFGISLHTIFQKRTVHTRRPLFLLCALILTGAAMMLGCAADIAVLLIKIQMIFIDRPETSLMDRVVTYTSLPWLDPIVYAVTVLTGAADCGFIFIVSDCLAVWRALSIWKLAYPRSLLTFLLYWLLFLTCGIFISPNSVFHSLTCQSPCSCLGNIHRNAVLLSLRVSARRERV
jgi:hypothetical protein